MGFIRIKKIKGQEYAYLVENKWYQRKHKGKGTGSRQAVSKYLGRVFSFPKSQEVYFLAFVKAGSFDAYLANTQEDQVIKDLVLWELFRHEISIEEFSIDFIGKKIMKKGREISLRINEGFLNSFTLRRIFHPTKEESYYLAKIYIEAGIEIPKEIFVGLYAE